MIVTISDGLIWYKYNNDVIAWNGEAYLSIDASRSFKTLGDMDEYWRVMATQND